MSAPNLFLIYVSDVQRATAFYSELFEIAPVARTPRYVPFEIAPGILFALWSGRSENATRRTPRTSEVGLMVPGGAAAIDEIYVDWTTKGAMVAEEPHDDVFGRTFVVTDPDGNLIRVSPLD